jgi:RimJ/RimL family protein N-acetyltransferase
MKAYWKVTNYYKLHGPKQTCQRVFESMRRSVFFRRYVIFSMDLDDWSFAGKETSHHYEIVCLGGETEISEMFMKQILEHHQEKMFREYLEKRFTKGAALWCFKKGDVLIGYFWSLIGKTMKPYYIPLMEKDVHIFDGFIFPKYRGHGEMAIMMNMVVDHLKTLGLRRIFIEAAEWNVPSLKFIEKMGYSRLGYARQRFRQRKMVVTWWVG